jgi:hypothetical protein
MKNTLKPILIILGLVALGAFVYIFLIRDPETASLTRTTPGGTTLPAGSARPSDQVNVEQFQKLLAELNSIRLDRGVFSREQYPSLIDHTQTALIKLDQTKAVAPLGKQNPFQALDGMSASVILQGTPSSR